MYQPVLDNLALQAVLSRSEPNCAVLSRTAITTPNQTNRQVSTMKNLQMPGVICKGRSEVGASTDKDIMDTLSSKNANITTARHYFSTPFETLRLSNVQRLCLRVRHSLREGSSSLMSRIPSQAPSPTTETGSAQTTVNNDRSAFSTNNTGKLRRKPALPGWLRCLPFAL